MLRNALVVEGTELKAVPHIACSVRVYWQERQNMCLSGGNRTDREREREIDRGRERYRERERERER